MFILVTLGQVVYVRIDDSQLTPGAEFASDQHAMPAVPSQAGSLLQQWVGSDSAESVPCLGCTTVLCQAVSQCIDQTVQVVVCVHNHLGSRAWLDSA